ncbi:hypothetical protein GA0115261_1023114, partial [Streptomyces sp. OspMP-M43]
AGCLVAAALAPAVRVGAHRPAERARAGYPSQS